MTNGRAASSRRAGVFAVLALAAAMLVGGAAGYALGRGSASRPPRMESMTLLGVSRATLLDSLELSPEQRERIDGLLTEAERRSQAAVESLMVDVRGATDEARREVRSLLNDRQRQRFDSILATATPLRPRTPVPPPSRSP